MSGSCMSLGFWMQVCIFVVIAMAVWSLIRLLLPYLLQFLPGVVVSIINILLWAIIAIIVIYIIFGLLACLLGAAGGLHFPH